MARACVWCFVFGSIVAGLVSGAQAEEYNYQNPIIGERSIGMGGAATAVADDAAAGFYNPAGLALSQFVSLSLSATVGELRWQEIESFLGQDGVSTFSWGLIASSWSWATDLWGGRFALSIFVPDSYDFAMNENVVTDLPMPDGNRLVHAQLIRQHSSDTYLAGPSLAFPLGERWALGGSLFFSYHTYKILVDDTYRYSNGALTQIIDNETGVTYGFQPRLGVLFKPIPELQLGLAAKLGYIFAAEGGRRRLRVESNDDTGQFTRVNLDDSFGGLGKDDRFNAKVSQGGSFGIAWQVSDRFLLSMDASLYSPVEYEWFDRTIEKEWTWNLALGGEWRVADTWPIRFGLFTNNSAAPDIERSQLDQIDPLTYSRDELPAAHVDFYGCALSLGHLSPTSTIDVSLQLIFGTGERVEVLETGAGVHDIFDVTVHLTLSGSYIFVDDKQELERRLEKEEESTRQMIRTLPSPWELQEEQEWKLQQQKEKKEPQNEWKLQPAPEPAPAAKGSDSDKQKQKEEQPKKDQEQSKSDSQPSNEWQVVEPSAEQD